MQFKKQNPSKSINLPASYVRLICNIVEQDGVSFLSYLDESGIKSDFLEGTVQFKKQNPSISINLPASYVRLICNIVEQDGVSFLSYLEESGIKSDFLEDDESLGFKQFCNAIVLLQEDQKDYASIGLIVGSQIFISAHGVVGLAAISSKTVAKGIDTIARYITTRESFFRLEVSSNQYYFYIDIVETFQHSKLQHSFVEVAMLLIQNVLEHLSGLKLTDSDLYFACSPPDYVDQYAHYFSGRITFDCDRHRIRIPLIFSEQVCASADDGINQMAEIVCRQKMSDLVDDSLTIDAVLAVMQGVNKPIPTLDALAALYSMSSRTMIRFLQSQGTSYRKLRDKVNQELAITYLRDENLSVNKTAYLLGYTDTASFRRAFKRWFDCTPTQYLQSGE